jgi:hypothetical protein
MEISTTEIGKTTAKIIKVGIYKISIGIQKYNNGDTYDGDWRENKKCGQGIFRYRAIGTMNYSNGDKYTGEWSNDQKNGAGNF